MNKDIKEAPAARLFEAILKLENTEECRAFFEDLCTVGEINSLAQRFEVASMLLDKRTYIEIAGATGASTATISRVNRSIGFGNGSYELMLDRIKPIDDEKDDEA